MRIIDAVWEKRNIGVDTIEIVCDGTESADELKSALEENLTAYNVLKIPVGNIDLLSAGQDCGFRLIEVEYRMRGRTNVAGFPEMYKRFEKYVRVVPASEELKNRILNEIGEGTIFSTDRIAIDRAFSQKLAGNRYKNWSMDVLKKGACLDVAFYKDEPVAFNIDTQPDENKVCTGILGGVLTNALDRGLGFLVPYVGLETCKRLGGKAVVAGVSSNNLPIMKLQLQFGFEIKDASYVLIKHQ